MKCCAVVCASGRNARALRIADAGAKEPKRANTREEYVQKRRRKMARDGPSQRVAARPNIGAWSEDKWRGVVRITWSISHAEGREADRSMTMKCSLNGPAERQLPKAYSTKGAFWCSSM